MKSSYILDFVNVEYKIVFISAFIYKILSDELNIQFLLNILLFNVMLNYSASIRNVVDEFENRVY